MEKSFCSKKSFVCLRNLFLLTKSLVNTKLRTDILFEMKKIVLAFGALGLMFAFPASAAVDFQVQNVSQDNANAVRVGGNSGDVLRYEISVSGEAEEGMETMVDLSRVLGSTTMVNAGGGVVENDLLTFPEDFCLTCGSQNFSFFVRVNKDCKSGDRLRVSFSGEELTVPLNCDDLPESGPAPLIFAVVAMMVILATVMFPSRKTN